MLVGVPKEIKPQETRVSLIPATIREIIHAGSQVLVEKGAGCKVGISDDDYRLVGAEIVDSAAEIFSRAELIIKVKEPLPVECLLLHEDQTIFTFLHLAADPKQAKLLKKAKVTAIAYETVTSNEGSLPLLTPMSQVAGRMSIQAGAHCLEMAQGGSGLLIGGVPGVRAANVVIIGGGVVGTNAACIAAGMGAEVIVLDRSLPRLQALDLQFGTKIRTVYAITETIENHIIAADLVIGAVLIPGAATPKLVTPAMLKLMRPGSVMVDVAIDQGGCFVTSKPTTHHHPTYLVDQIIHYCVTNMPGAVPRTATFALNNATLTYILSLVTKGIKEALLTDLHFQNGLNIHKGMITNKAVAQALESPYVAPIEALNY